MKKIILLALLAALIAAPALSQNPVPTEFFKGFINGLPSATTPLSSGDKLYVLQGGVSKSVPGTSVGGGGTPGGTNGQVQYNNSGAFGGFTLSGDCTLLVSGVITCTQTNGTPFGTFATQNASSPPAIGTSAPNTGQFTNLTSTVGAFPGFLSASGASLNSATIVSLGGSTQCVESVGGVLTGTGSGCGTGGSSTSIAAGTNITTSGTATNVTVSVVPSPTVGALTVTTVAAVPGFLTASGASFQTATIAGNLTGSTANFSGNLTAATAQFTGAVTGTTAQYQTRTGATLNLTGNLTGATAQFSGALTGTTAIFQTITDPFIIGGTGAASTLTLEDSSANVPTGSITLSAPNIIFILTSGFPAASLFGVNSGINGMGTNAFCLNVTTASLANCNGMFTSAQDTNLRVQGPAVFLQQSSGSSNVVGLQSGNWIPVPDNAVSNGLSSNRWSAIWGVNLTSTIGAFPGWLTASGAAFQTATIGGNNINVTIAAAGTLNYYVKKTGSDSNNGLAIGTPFLTIQHAVNVASQWSQDTTTCSSTGCSNSIVINVDGSGATYTENLYLPPIPKPVPQQGGTGFPTNIAILGINGTPVIDGCIYTNARNWSLLSPLKFINDTTACPTIQVEGGRLAVIGTFEFGTNSMAQPHVLASNSAEIDLSGNYTVSGGASQHLIATAHSKMTTGNITFTNTPTFSDVFIEAADSTIDNVNNTYTNAGAVTTLNGPYRSIYGGNLMTTGTGMLTFFPGTGTGQVNNDSAVSSQPGSEVPTTFATANGRFAQTGSHRVINDGLAANCGDSACSSFGTIVSAGGGSTVLGLFYDGTHWRLAGSSTSGFLTAGGASLAGLSVQTETITSNLTGATANFSGNLTGTTAQLSGLLTGTTAQFQTMTIGSLGASTQCLESVAGVITGFGSGCGGGSATSIAAGSNITTSGTATNVTVNVVATPTFTALTSTVVSVPGWLTASGINLQTATIAGNLTGTTSFFSDNGSQFSVVGSTAQFSTYRGGVLQGLQSGNFIGNLTAQTAQFAGFLTAGGASLSGLTIQTATLSGNLTGATANFSGNLTAATAQFTGLATGTTATFQTFSGAAVNLTNSLTNTNGVLSINASNTTITDAINIGTTSGGNWTNVIQSPGFRVDGQGDGFATGRIDITGSSLVSGFPALNLYTTASGGWALFANGGALNFATINGSGNFLSTFFAMNTVGAITTNLTGSTANFSGNLTAQTVQFPGWLTASGANLQTATIAGNLTGATANFSGNLTGTTAQFTGTLTGTTGVFQTHTGGSIGNPGLNAGQISFISPSVSQFGTAGVANGYLNWGGESRLTATKSLFNSVSLTPTALSVNLQGGRTYAIDADLYLNVGAAIGGIQVALSGTYGSTATNYFGYAVDGGSAGGTFGTINGIKGAALSAAKNGVVANTLLSGTTGYVKISGTVSASSSGTLVVVAAQNTVNSASPTTLTIGSRLIVQDMP